MKATSPCGQHGVPAATAPEAVPTHGLTTGAEGGTAGLEPSWPRGSPGTGQPFPKQWEACWGCAWLSPLHPPVPTWSTSSPHQALSKGQLWKSLSDSAPTSRWNRKTHGQGWGGSRCPSPGMMQAAQCSASPGAVGKWAQVALLSPCLMGTAACSHFPRPRLAWMSLIAQRSLSPSPGPRV